VPGEEHVLKGVRRQTRRVSGEEAGSALLYGVFLMLLLAILATGVLTIADAGVRDQNRWEGDNWAFYAAQSGMEDARYRLANRLVTPPSASFASDPAVMGPDASYTVQLSAYTNRPLSVQVVSTGTSRGRSRTVRATLTTGTPPAFDVPSFGPCAGVVETQPPQPAGGSGKGGGNGNGEGNSPPGASQSNDEGSKGTSGSGGGNSPPGGGGEQHGGNGAPGGEGNGSQGGGDNQGASHPCYVPGYPVVSVQAAFPSDLPDGSCPASLGSGGTLPPGTYVCDSVTLGQGKVLRASGPVTLYVKGGLRLGQGSALQAQGPLVAYVQEDLTADEQSRLSLSGPARLVVQGDVRFTEGASLTPSPGPVDLVVGGSLTLDNGAALGAAPAADLIAWFDTQSDAKIQFHSGSSATAGVYAPSRAVTFDNNASLTGAVVAAVVSPDSPAPVTYDPSLAWVAPYGASWAVQTGSWSSP
jgi:hypothetical protein